MESDHHFKYHLTHLQRIYTRPDRYPTYELIEPAQNPVSRLYGREGNFH